MVRSLFLFFLISFPAFAAEEGSRYFAVREMVCEREQVCFHQGFALQPKFAERQREFFLSVQKSLEKDLKEHGIQNEPLPSGWKFDVGAWKNADRWNDAFARLSPPQRCDRLELAYTYAVIELSTLLPTVPIQGFRDILFNETSLDVLIDRQRAAWALRYAKFVAPKDVPRECDSLAKDAELRWNYIFTNRKPLGYAIGMCGRPMNAHYLDDEVTGKKRPEPAGWRGSPEYLGFWMAK